MNKTGTTGNKHGVYLPLHAVTFARVAGMSQESTDPSGTTEAWQAFVNRTEAPTPEPRSSTTGLWIVAIVVVVIAIGALFYFLATG
jgi:hypothetical protein